MTKKKTELKNDVAAGDLQADFSDANKTEIEKPTEELSSKEPQQSEKLVNIEIEEKKDDDLKEELKSETEIVADENDSAVLADGEGKIVSSANSIEKQTIEEIGISEEIINEKVKNVLEQTAPKKRRKSTIINCILMAINIVLLVFIVKGLLGSLEDSKSIFAIFSQQGKRMWWLGGGVAMYIFYIIIQMLMYKLLVKNLSGKKGWGIAYDAAIVGKYYDSITPFAVGGQTMQIMRLMENGIGAGVSTSIPVLKMIINSGINALLALIFFVFGLPFMPKTSFLNDFLILLLEIVGVIGLIITVLMALFIFFISSGTLVTRSLISGVLRIGYKLKIIKDYRTTHKKVMNQVAEYKFSISYLWRHKKILLNLILYSVLECLSYASLAFFVAMAFAENLEMSTVKFMFICLAMYYLCAMASCYIPLPGGTGLMEVSFVLLFGLTLGNNVVWALICWRFLTYYFIIIHGFIHEVRKIITNIVKSKKLKRKIERKVT